MFTNLHEMPSHARVWVYQSNRRLTDHETEQISALTHDFVNEWTAHKQQLKASFEIRYGHFLILLIDEKAAAASGCSIDASVHFIRSLEQKFGLNLLDRLTLAYWADGSLKLVSKDEFEKRMEKGEIHHDTIVFNNLVQSKIDLDSKWEVPLKDSWHKALLEV
jgi:hypothetical protein